MPSTTNFSWTTPADTDLVKDGALAIRTLGNGIDTSLVDLKGGTTGQALTKQTNTDLDYQWTDIIPANQSFFAGKNKILNSDFSIWARGTSFTNPAFNAYTADRFICDPGGASGGTTTISRQTFSPGTAPVAGYEGSFFARYNMSVASTSQVYNNPFAQRIEDVRTFAGQTVTVSIWAKSDSSRNFVIQLQQNFGSGGSTAVGATSSTFTATTSWQRFTFTTTLGSMSGKTIGTSSYLAAIIGLSANNTVQTFDIWGLQVEAGSSATAFQIATGNPQGELAACQRYYFRTSAGSAFGPFGVGQTSSTTAAAITVHHPSIMRVAPTSIDFANVQVSFPGGSGAVSALTINQTNERMSTLSATSTGLTSNLPAILRGDNNTAGYVGLNAEL